MNIFDPPNLHSAGDFFIDQWQMSNKGWSMLVFLRRLLGVHGPQVGSGWPLCALNVQNDPRLSIVIKSKSALTAEYHVSHPGDSLRTCLSQLDTDQASISGWVLQAAGWRQQASGCPWPFPELLQGGCWWKLAKICSMASPICLHVQQRKWPTKDHLVPSIR